MYRVDLSEIMEHVKVMRMEYIILVILLKALAILLSSLSWHIMTRPFGKRGVLELYKLYFSSQFYNLLGLGTIPGDTMRAFELSKDMESPTQSVVSVIGERVLSFASMLLLASFGFVLYYEKAPILAFIIWVVSAFYFTLVASSLVIEVHVPDTESNGSFFSKVKKQILDMLHQFNSYRKYPGLLASSLIVAVGVQLVVAVTTWVIALSVGADKGLMVFLFIAPVIAILVLLPISIQGIGVRETAYVFMFELIGIPLETALIASLLSFALTQFINLTGGAIVLHGTIKK